MPEFLKGGYGKGSNMDQDKGAIPGVDGAKVTEQVPPGGKEFGADNPVRDQGMSASTGGYRADPRRDTLPSPEEIASDAKKRGAANETDGKSS